MGFKDTRGLVFSYRGTKNEKLVVGALFYF